MIFGNSHGGKYKDYGLQYVPPWGLVDRYQRFGEYSLYFHGTRSLNWEGVFHCNVGVKYVPRYTAS